MNFISICLMAFMTIFGSVANAQASDYLFVDQTADSNACILASSDAAASFVVTSSAGVVIYNDDSLDGYLDEISANLNAGIYDMTVVPNAAAKSAVKDYYVCLQTYDMVNAAVVWSNTVGGFHTFEHDAADDFNSYSFSSMYDVDPDYDNHVALRLVRDFSPSYCDSVYVFGARDDSGTVLFSMGLPPKDQSKSSPVNEKLTPYSCLSLSGCQNCEMRKYTKYFVTNYYCLCKDQYGSSSCSIGPTDFWGGSAAGWADTNGDGDGDGGIWNGL